MPVKQGTADSLLGKEFPCPVCGMALLIRISRKEKPYCVCHLCGIQLFVRGKKGIYRLQKLVESEALISAEGSTASTGITLYNRLQHLQMQREELEKKQGMFFRDSALDQAISAVEADIERLQAILKEVAGTKRMGGEK